MPDKSIDFNLKHIANIYEISVILGANSSFGRIIVSKLIQ